jgi:activator of 2-hydroxyglutaryl-CoA dehydratase
MTIIDIGGQDNKIIKVDEKGRRLNFKMNRKCAAGTGAFLEEMSMRLDIPLEEMDALGPPIRAYGGAGQLLYGFFRN